MNIDELPPDHGDPLAEARACRASAALFDFSFVARARLRGRAALALLERFAARRLADLPPGRIRYALRLGADHAVEADLTVWRHGQHDFELMSGRREEVAALRTAVGGDVAFEDHTDDGFIHAVQGPRSLAALATLADGARLTALPWFGFAPLEVAGVPCLVGRLGYSGERGFEVVGPRVAAVQVWQALAAVARPAGAVAMDWLRIEAGLMLFTRECALRPRPVELGLEGFVALPSPLPRMRLACFTLADAPAVAALPQRRPRAGEIAVTSLGRAAHSGAAIGLGFVPAAELLAGAEPRDLAGRCRGLRLLPGPALTDARARPRGRWTPPA